MSSPIAGVALSQPPGGQLTIVRTVRRVALPLVVAAIIGSGCGATTTPSANQASASPLAAASARSSNGPAGSPDALAELVAAAEAEGNLTTIGLSHEWCGYGEALKTFATRYAITINELNPDAGFDAQLAALKDTKDGKASPELAPDVIDVGMGFGARAKAAGLLAPFKVSTWDTIPKGVKDPDGAWYGDYYGVLVFETNVSAGSKPPTDWDDLLDPSRKNEVALAGDPRVSNQAIETVYAAALANGGKLTDARPGLDFFADLKKAGNLLPTIATPATIDDGTTPVTIRWTYSALAHRDVTNGTTEIEVTVPTSGRLAGTYVQAISAFAPHPNAARLWIEFLYSDEGQNIWLKANCFPVRLDDLVTRDAIAPEVLANLPDIEGAVFPTLDQLNAATTLITGKWDSVVGVDIK
jgi:putative spermidine/putrescine transport system substrate-binding protein